MHPRTQEVLDYLDTERDALRAVLKAVSPVHREQRPAAERWSVAEVLEHLTLVEGRITNLVASRLDAARAAGLGPEQDAAPILPTVDVALVLDRSQPRTASDAAQPRTGLDADAAWRKLERGRVMLREMVVQNDGLALSEVTAPHAVLGSLNLYQWLIFIGAHEARHAAQIREGAATQSPKEGASAESPAA